MTTQQLHDVERLFNNFIEAANQDPVGITLVFTNDKEVAEETARRLSDYWIKQPDFSWEWEDEPCVVSAPVINRDGTRQYMIRFNVW